MRSRANRARRIDEIPDDPLDEDEQEEIAKTLTHDASAQMKELSDIFGIICALAAITSLGCRCGCRKQTKWENACCCGVGSTLCGATSFISSGEFPAHHGGPSPGNVPSPNTAVMASR